MYKLQEKELFFFCWSTTDRIVKLDWSKIIEKEFLQNFKQAQAHKNV